MLEDLEPITISHQPGCRIWTLDTPGIFTCKSFFDYLTNGLTKSAINVAEGFGKVLIPTKVRVYAQTVPH